MVAQILAECFAAAALCQAGVIQHGVIRICLQKCEKRDAVPCAIVIERAGAVCIKKAAVTVFVQLAEHGAFCHVVSVEDAVGAGKVRRIAVIQKDAAGEGVIPGGIGIDIPVVVLALHNRVIDLGVIDLKPCHDIRVHSAQCSKPIFPVDFLFCRAVDCVDLGIRTLINVLVVPQSIRPETGSSQHKQSNENIQNSVQQLKYKVHQCFRFFMQDFAAIGRVRANTGRTMSSRKGRFFSTRPVTGTSP